VTGDDRSTLAAELRMLRIGDIRKQLKHRGVKSDDLFEKDEFVLRLAEVISNDRKHFCRSGRVIPGQVADLTGLEFERERRDTSTPLLLDVHAETWCGPCRTMAPNLDAAAVRLARRARVVKLDSDTEQQVVGRLGVRAFPTIVLFNCGGVEVCRREGALSEDDLVNMVDVGTPH